MSTDAEVADLLARGTLSIARLSDMGLGSVGITLNPHLLLDANGAPTGWVVKRLRSRWYADPAETFARFRREHALLCRYFCASDAKLATGMVPETHFFELNLSFDTHPDYVPGREFVMVQRFISGGLLCDTLGKDSGTNDPWLLQRIRAFASAYSRIQEAEGVLPDCFSIRSDHLRADSERQILVLVDTNNLMDIRAEVLRLTSIRDQFPADLASTTTAELRFCMAGVLSRAHGSGLRGGWGSQAVRDLHTLSYLARWFPPDGSSNPLLKELNSVGGV